MALAVEWLPEEWPEGIPNLKQLLVVAPLTTSILLLLAPTWMRKSQPAHGLANSRAGRLATPRSASRPPLFLHRRLFRFSLTPTSARNSIISKFRRLQRDSRSVVQGPFL